MVYNIAMNRYRIYIKFDRRNKYVMLEYIQPSGETYIYPFRNPDEANREAKRIIESLQYLSPMPNIDFHDFTGDEVALEMDSDISS